MTRLIALLRWLWELTLHVINEVRKDDVGDLAASITFWALLSVPAAVLAIVSALGSLERFVGRGLAESTEQRVLDFVEETFTDDSSTLSNAVSELFGATNAGLVTIAALFALWSMSRGFAGLIRALDRAYDVDEGRSWWHIRLVAIGLGFGSVAALAVIVVLLELLPQLPGGNLVLLVTAPAAFIVVALFISALFHIGPNHRTPWRYDLPGAAFATLGWTLLTQGYSQYIQVINRGNQIQTSVGAVILALTFAYLLAVVLLVGAELNGVLSQRAGVVSERPSLSRLVQDIADRMDD